MVAATTSELGEIAMADVCPSYDDRLTTATPWCPADVAASTAQVASASSTTASAGACCTGAGTAAEI